jgi:hypothetical protein
MLAHQVGMVEIEFFGKDTGATNNSYFIGKFLLTCSAGTLTATSIGTDLSDATSAAQIAVTGLVGTLGIKAKAADTNGVVKVRVIGGGTDAANFGITLTAL